MSSGKVKCTCGWSWNKSDSSKKDMYICHECGRDNSNNMKNGGWLDSYADGGTMQEHQENYNNSEVSLPEGFVGMGNNTKGRNYSPAWGGQFQMGGSVYPVNYVPQAQNGKKNKKIKEKKIEERIDDFLGNPQAGARAMADINPDEDPVDNIRHSFAGRYTQDAIAKKLGNSPIAKAAGLVGSNLMGAAHELSTIVDDDRPWLTKLRESGEDMINNAVGSVVGVIPFMDEKAKDKMIYKMSYGNLLPDGYVSTEKGRKKGQSDNMYFKNKQGKVDREYQMGGSLPGAGGHFYARYEEGGKVPGDVGFDYPRTINPAPDNGPGAKKTMASAQNGKEMKYYQEGLDFKPKSISKNGGWLDSYEEGGVIKDDMGYWNPDNWGSPVEIGSTDITMEGVYEPLLGISDTGDTKLMKPGKNYKFKGKKVTEYPMAKNGLRQEQKGLVNLDQLTNFTNYNTKQPGGWLDNL